MREDDELRLAMVVLGAIHAEYGLTVTLRRETAHRGGPREGDGDEETGERGARRPGATCGPRGWRARAVLGDAEGGTRAASAWAARPYEAACRLVELLDRAGEAVA